MPGNKGQHRSESRWGFSSPVLRRTGTSRNGSKGHTCRFKSIGRTRNSGLSGGQPVRSEVPCSDGHWESSVVQRYGSTDPLSVVVGAGHGREQGRFTSTLLPERRHSIGAKHPRRRL